MEERVDEDIEPGFILASVFATDADLSYTLTYSLAPSQGSEKFRLNSTTGVLSLAAKLDAEEISKYLLAGMRVVTSYSLS